MDSKNLRQRRLSSPLGALLCVADDEALLGLFQDTQAPPAELAQASPTPAHPILDRAAAELDAYFAGEPVRFSVPVAPRGTEFQQLVWNALREIPYGETRSYGDIARTLGRPRAVRAVGAANGKNPIGIVIPCHRVLGADGSLTGYAGGTANKRWLLAHERSQGWQRQ